MSPGIENYTNRDFSSFFIIENNKNYITLAKNGTCKLDYKILPKYFSLYNYQNLIDIFNIDGDIIKNIYTEHILKKIKENNCSGVFFDLDFYIFKK